MSIGFTNSLYDADEQQGNHPSRRAVIMQVKGMSGSDVVSLKLAAGVPIVYKIDEQGKMMDKRVLE